MRKEPSNKLINLGLYLLLFFLSSNLLAQTPSAEVLSGDTAICEPGNVTLRIKFTGQSPFGIAYEKYVNGTLIGTDIQLTPIFNDFWETTFGVSANTTIKVVRVYDDTTEKPWNYPANGVDVTGQEMNIHVDHMPTPDAGNDISALCGYTATMTAIPGDISNPYYWKETVDGIFADRNDPGTAFEATTHGTYTLWFIEKSGVCKDSSSVSVNLLGSPKATLSGSETICSTDGNSNQITLTVDYNSSFAPYSYTVSDGTNSYDRNDNSATPDVFSVQAAGNQNFTITSMSDTRIGKQCYSVEGDDGLSGSAVVTDLKPAAYAGGDKIVCGELSTTLEATLEYPANSGLWTGNNISFSDDVLPNTQATASGHGIYSFTWTETEPVMQCVNSNDVEINFAEAPGLAYSNDTAICKGGIATLNLNASGNSPWSLTYNIDGGSGTDLVLNTPTETKDFSPVSTTTVTLDSIVGNYGCIAKINKNYIITVDEMPVANAGLYDPVFGNKIQLNAISSLPNSLGYWEGVGKFENDKVSSTLFTTVGTGNQTLIWTEINSENKACATSDDVTILFNRKNTNGFSPNGDGVNDFFKIMGADQIPGNELKVVDRKGKLVYSTKNYNNDWDGVGMDGSPLSDGTYYYVFTGDNIDPIKEYLIIKRSKTE